MAEQEIEVTEGEESERIERTIDRQLRQILDRITPSFVEDRAEALKDRWAERNDRMDKYERLYLLDMWESQAEPDQTRICPPICWTRVEAFRPLFLTRPPVISVPASEFKGWQEERAQKLEDYLYGVWYQADVMTVLDQAEWAACCLGEGVVRCLYDDGAADGELPLLLNAIDPREVYPTPDVRPGHDKEVMFICKRTRREIESEWGVELRQKRPSDTSELENWLDEEVEMRDYWRSEIVTYERQKERPRPEVEAGGGALGGAVSWIQDQWRRLFGEEEGEEPGTEEPEMETVRQRVVIHCVAVEGEDRFVKEPVRMPGYNRLPFIRYPGISTVLNDEDGALSVLFPITAGKMIGERGSKGLAAATAELINYKQEIIKRYANAALLSTIPADQIDFSPGGVTEIDSNDRIEFLLPPGTHPDTDEQMQLFQTLIEDATVSRAMMGQYVGDLSGLALTAINNPVLMRIAARQKIRERAYQALNELILSLTEQYAPPDGWYVWGADARGTVIETQLKPDEIDGYYRNRVELSASLPKDEAGEIMALSQLQKSGQISMETFLDNFQRIKHTASQSPADEIKRILRDRMLLQGPLAEKLAEIVLSEYDEALAAALTQAAQQRQQQAQQPPQQPQGMGPPGMQGLPPGVVPPGAMPPAVGLENMMAMEGQPMPGMPPEGL